MHDINNTVMTVKKFYKLNVHTYIMYYPLYKTLTPLLTNNNKKFIILTYFDSLFCFRESALYFTVTSNFHKYTNNQNI